MRPGLAATLVRPKQPSISHWNAALADGSGTQRAAPHCADNRADTTTPSPVGHTRRGQEKEIKAYGEGGTTPLSGKNPDIYSKQQPEGKNSVAWSPHHCRCTIMCQIDLSPNEFRGRLNERHPRGPDHKRVQQSVSPKAHKAAQPCTATRSGNGGGGGHPSKSPSLPKCPTAPVGRKGNTTWQVNQHLPRAPRNWKRHVISQAYLRHSMAPRADNDTKRDPSRPVWTPLPIRVPEP